MKEKILKKKKLTLLWDRRMCFMPGLIPSPARNNVAKTLAAVHLGEFGQECIFHVPTRKDFEVH